MPEGCGIFPNLTVDENLQLGAYLRGDPAGVARDRDRALERFPRIFQILTEIVAEGTTILRSSRTPAWLAVAARAQEVGARVASGPAAGLARDDEIRRADLGVHRDRESISVREDRDRAQQPAGGACPRPGRHSILAAMKLLVAAALVLAACGSNPQSTTTPTTPTTPKEGATVALPDVPFADLDHDQRIAFMKQKVMPVMKPIFQNHDAKDFAGFGCKTCHGEQAKDGHFDMPNPKLPKLDFNDLSEFKKEDLEWMGKEVMPAMGKVLNLPLYSKDNPKGFGCLACHTLKGKDEHNDHK